MHRRPTLLVWLVALSTIVALGCNRAPSAPEPEPTASSASPPAVAEKETASVKEPPTPSLAEQVASRLDRGLDISTHSGTVDWQQVAAAGYSFAFAKATEGVDLADSAFADHWPAIKAAGLVRGAYHFYVTEDDPEAQAQFFTSTVTLEPGDLAPVVDIELIGHGTQPGLADRLQTFLDLIEAHYGIQPILYTAPNFWNTHLTDDFGSSPLWVAEYGVDAPQLPNGWDAWTLWQWQGDATVAGVEKGADLNRVNHEQHLSALVVR